VIDSSTDLLTRTIPVGPSPQGSAVTPDGNRLFVIHQSGAPVTVVDTTTNLVIASIPIGGDQAKDILFTRNGRNAYIANYSEGTVDVIDTATYRVKNISTGAGPRRLALGVRVVVVPMRYWKSTSKPGNGWTLTPPKP
jgi:YVTN family beta-propeller protein